MKYFFSILCCLTLLSACGNILSPLDEGNASNLGVLPGTPSNLIVAASDTQAQLSWTAPDNAGEVPVTDYAIQFSPEDGTWTDFEDGVSTETNAVVTGLTDGTAYLFRVAAVNSAGVGSYSSASDSVIPQDTTSPGVSLSSSAPASTNIVISVNVTFTESVTGFDAADLSITNGTPSALTGSGSSYSFTVTPDSEGLVTISIPASVAQDEAGNNNLASNTISHTYDNTPPSSPSISINSGAAYTTTSLVDLTLSATDSPFEMYVTNSADCATGGAWESYSTSKTAWVLDQDNSTATIYVKFKDAAGNESACASDTIIHDNTAPTSPTISIDSGAATTSSTSVALTLSATGATQMIVTETEDCTGGSPEVYSPSKASTLSSGAGTKTLSVKYLDDAGNASACISDSITLLPAPPPDPSNFSASVEHSTQITLNWTSGGGTTDTFQVVYQTGSTAPADCSSGTVVSFSEIGAVTSTVITVSSGTDYAFRLCARDSYGQFSNGITTTGTTGWANEAYLKAPNNGSNDWFGYSSSISGDTLVVGAPTEDNGVTTITNGTHTSGDESAKTDSGAAYVFKRNGTIWTNEAYLKAPNSSEGDYFGWSTSISGDTIVVGAYYEDNNVTVITNGTHTAADEGTSADSGAAYVFKRTGSTWTNEAYLKAPNAHSTDYFGYSTSISGDTIVIGAYYEDNSATTITNGTHSAVDLGNSAESGAAYVFKRTGTTWINEAYLKSPNNSAGDRFGSPVRISGDMIVVGAYAEDNSATTITSGTHSSADIGTSSNSGAVYVFKRTGNNWENEAYLKAPNNSSGDFFGWAVSISADTIVVGSYNEDNSATTIVNGTHTAADLGTNTDGGAAYVFKRTGSVWANEAYLKAPNNSVDDSFGWPLAISGDTIVVSALYEDNSVATITNGTYTEADAGTNSNSGAVYVFKRTGSAWANEAYLKAPNNSAADQFGRSVSISGDTIAVGAFQEDNSAATITNGTHAAADIGTSSNSGAVYVFRRPETLSSPVVSSVTPNSNLVAGDSVVIFGSGFRKDATVTVGGVACNSKTVQGPKEIICVLPSAPGSNALDISVTNPDNSTDTLSGALSYDTTPPGSPMISINSDASTTSSTSVTLTLSAVGATQMYVTETSGCASGGTLEAYNTSRAWTLSSGDGTKTVYVKYLDAAENASSCVSDSITLLPAPPPDPSLFSATVDHSTQVTLSWTSGAGTTDSFQVAYQTGSTAPADCESGTVVSYSTIGSSTSTAITVSPVTDYAFRVCARDTYGQFSSGVTTTATTGWYQEAYIKTPNAEASDYFGWSVSISGDTLVAGATWEDSNQTTVTNGTTVVDDNSLIQSGAAYVFRRSGITWTHEAYLKASNPGTDDRFGGVSVSGDTIVVGSVFEDSNQTTITNGSAVSDNDSATNSGGAYVFKRSGNTWTQEAYLKAPNSEAYDLFGFNSVSISGDTIVVGAGWEDSNQTTITGGTVVVDNNSATDSGAAYVFQRSGSTWVHQAYLKAPNSGTGDYFGYNTSISGDNVVVSAFMENSSSTTITNSTSVIDNDSATDSGAAYVFQRSGSAWVHQAYLKAPNSGSSDYFSDYVSISGDTIVVGAYQEDSNRTTITNGTSVIDNDSATDSGAAYVFQRSGSTWAHKAYLKAPNSGTGDNFSYHSVSISGDTVVVGAYHEDSNHTTITNGTSIIDNDSATDSGAAYVFKRSGSTWAHEAYLKAPNSEANDLFGINISVSGDTIAVGSMKEDSNQTTITNGTTASSNNFATDSGAVYVFRRASTTGLTPSITSVSPSSFSVAGGGIVSIFGSGFQSGATVTVGGSTCTNPIWQGYNEILCTLPAGTSGAAEVIVTNPGGANGSSSSTFSYVMPPDPTGFTATVDHSTQITVNWLSGGGTTDSFQVAYQTGSTAPADCASGTVVSFSTIGSSTSVAISVNAAADYVFRVCARDAFGGFSSGTTATATTGWYQEAYLKASNAGVNDTFGISTSFSGDTIVVGAYGEGSSETTITNGITSASDGIGYSGAAYVFKRESGAWVQEAYLKASNAGLGDSFGVSTSISGDTVVVGAYGEGSTETTITNGITSAGDGSSYSGAAYVFKRTGSTWVQESYLKASNAGSWDWFGRFVSISGDTIVVGAYAEDSTETTITNGITSAGDGSDGSGAAYVFKRTGSSWTQEAYLKASNAESGDQFGNSVAISGDTIVVGASFEDSDETTITNGITTAGNLGLYSNVGAAYVFKRTGSNWAQEAYLKASNAGSGDGFGSANSISGDTIVVGVSGEGSSETTITNGTTSAGDGSWGSGAAYVFKRTGSNWAQEAYLKASNADEWDDFGYSASISGDTIVVGADLEFSNQTTITNGITNAGNEGSYRGAAYVFKRTGTTWVQEAYLKAPNSGDDDYFGISVAISGDSVVVGATGEDSSQTTITNGTTASSDNSAGSSGAVYVFRRAETLATPVVSSVTPSTGGTSGMNVVIFGSGFRKDATVTIGGAACTTKTVQGPNEIICTLPSNSAGAQAIVVTNPGGSTSNTDITVTY